MTFKNLIPIDLQWHSYGMLGGLEGYLFIELRYKIKKEKHRATW